MKKKVAIVYDWIDKWGGVERVLLALHDLLPDAVFYTSYADRAKAGWAKDLTIKTSYIQHLPFFIKENRVLSVPFFPYAFESFDFSTYDVVISVSSSFAKGIITKPDTFHLLYHLTPTRFLWTSPDFYIKSTIAKQYARGLKKWDYAAAQRPDRIFSISKTVAARTKKYYDRASGVIYPPFALTYWKSVKKRTTPFKGDPFYLLVSRLEPYKNVELVVDAFNTLGDEKLVIIGKGTLADSLKQKAHGNIRFLSDLSDDELARYYQSATALIMPQEEDFGYVAIEAQLFGLPVIAYNKGGATETVVKDRTGVFFEKQSVDSLVQALTRFKKNAKTLGRLTSSLPDEYFDPFRKNNFNESFLKEIEEAKLVI